MFAVGSSRYGMSSCYAAEEDAAMLHYRTQLPEEMRAERNRPQELPGLALEAPASVGVYLSAAQASGEQDLVTMIRRALHEALQAAIAAVQDWISQTHGVPLQITAEADIHEYVHNHEDVPRPHYHVRLARHALDKRGRQTVIDRSAVVRAAPIAQVTFHTTLAGVIEQHTDARFVRSTTPTGWEIAGLDALAATVPRQRCDSGHPQLFPLDQLQAAP